MSQLALFNVPAVPRTVHSFSGHIPGLSLHCQYLLVISPPPVIYAAVDGMKADLDRLLGGGHKWKWSKPHITLATITAARVDEPILLDLLRQACIRHWYFDLHFENYDQFEQNRVVFVDPIEKEPIAALCAEIVRMVRSCTGMGPREVMWSSIPHMTIAKGLFKRGDFERALKFFEGRPYCAHMTVDRILLLRRGVQPTTYYERVDELILGSSTSKPANASH